MGHPINDREIHLQADLLDLPLTPRGCGIGRRGGSRRRACAWRAAGWWPAPSAWTLKTPSPTSRSRCCWRSLIFCRASSSFFFRGPFSATRSLPRFGTAGQPLNYQVEVTESDGHSRRLASPCWTIWPIRARRLTNGWRFSSPKAAASGLSASRNRGNEIPSGWPR